MPKLVAVSIVAERGKIAFFFRLGEKVARDAEHQRVYKELADSTMDIAIQLC